MARNRTDKKASTWLRSLPITAACTDRELAEIDRCATVIDIPAGTIIIRQGTVGRQAFVVVRGTVEISVDDAVITEVGPGALLGEMALLDGGPRSATAKAKTAVQVLTFDPRGLSDLLGHERVAANVMRQLAGRIRDADGQTEAEGASRRPRAATVA